LCLDNPTLTKITTIAADPTSATSYTTSRDTTSVYSAEGLRRLVLAKV
jgi:hypothetical protein